MALLLDGKKLRDKIGEELKTKIVTLKSKPCLAIIQVDQLSQSSIYIRQKKLFGEKIGVEVRHIQLPKSVSQDEANKQVQLLNADPAVHGIILQLPLPSHLNKDSLLESVDPSKDVDGLHSVNLKKLMQGNSVSGKDGFIPATAKGVVKLLKENAIALEGKHVLIIGRSLLVGQSLALLLLNENATVTIAHKKSRDIPNLARQANIIVSAAGEAGLVTKDFVNSSQVIVDVGINVSDGKIVGDVVFEEVSPIVYAITPVPGGVGPMTIASLFENLLEAYLL